MRNAIGLPKEKRTMKFKDAIYNIEISTIITDTINWSDMPIYHKNGKRIYQVKIYCTDSSTLVRSIANADELNFFIDTLTKLAYHCDYDFESSVDVLDLVSKIYHILWWDIGYMVDSVNNIVKEVTGLDLARL